MWSGHSEPRRPPKFEHERDATRAQEHVHIPGSACQPGRFQLHCVVGEAEVLGTPDMWLDHSDPWRPPKD
jgi:hypothetical protein